MLSVTWELPRKASVVEPWRKAAHALGRAPIELRGSTTERFWRQEIPRHAYPAAIEALVRASMACIGPRAPSLAELGIRWEPECCGEVWRAWDVLVARGSGDCEDIAAAHCAWLRVVAREQARCAWERQGDLPNGGIAWHVVVRRADGTRDDPSHDLGMHDGVACDARGPCGGVCDPQTGRTHRTD